MRPGMNANFSYGDINQSEEDVMQTIETTTKLHLRRETLRVLTAQDLRLAVAAGNGNVGLPSPKCV